MSHGSLEWGDKMDALIVTMRAPSFRCYVCQERFALPALVLNDRCRHAVCRECFVKVSYDAFNRGQYRCLACDTYGRRAEHFVCLSPGVDAVHGAGYLVHMLDTS